METTVTEIEKCDIKRMMLGVLLNEQNINFRLLWL